MLRSSNLTMNQPLWLSGRKRRMPVKFRQGSATLRNGVPPGTTRRSEPVYHLSIPESISIDTGPHRHATKGWLIHHVSQDTTNRIESCARYPNGAIISKKLFLSKKPLLRSTWPDDAVLWHFRRSSSIKQPARPCRVVLVTQDFDHILISNSRRNQVVVWNLAGSAPLHTSRSYCSREAGHAQALLTCKQGSRPV